LLTENHPETAGKWFEDEAAGRDETDAPESLRAGGDDERHQRHRHRPRLGVHPLEEHGLIDAHGALATAGLVQLEAQERPGHPEEIGGRDEFEDGLEDRKSLEN